MSPANHHVWWIVPVWAHHVTAHATIFRMLELHPTLKVTVFYHALISATIVTKRTGELTLGTMVENDLSSYPRRLSDRVDWVPCGPMNTVLDSTTATTLASDLVQTFCKISPTLDNPSKFIADRFHSLEILPVIKRQFPIARSYMWWSPAATGLYSTIGRYFP